MTITFYREQIRRAETELARLPDTVYGWRMQRQIEAERRALLRDIEHYERLIVMEAEADKENI